MLGAARSLPLVREPLSAEAAIELATMLKALSDPVRLRLLSVVASHSGGEACVCDISAGIDRRAADGVASPQGAAQRRTP